MSRNYLVWFWLLVFSVVFSGLAVVYAKNQSHELFIELQESRRAHAQALAEWGRWQLELATQGNLQDVMQIAHSRLDMHIPQNNPYLIVDP